MDMPQGQSLGHVPLILEKALDGERISDEEALVLLIRKNPGLAVFH